MALQAQRREKSKRPEPGRGDPSCELRSNGMMRESATARLLRPHA